MSYFYQCTTDKHTNEPIVGLCLEVKCNETPQFCPKCLLEKKKHENHPEFCKTIEEMKTLLTQYLRILLIFIDILVQDFKAKKNEHDRLQKFITYLIDIVRQLEVGLQNQEFELLTQRSKILKQLHQIISDKDSLNWNNIGDQLKRIKSLSQTFEHVDCHLQENLIEGQVKQHQIQEESIEKKKLGVQDKIIQIEYNSKQIKQIKYENNNSNVQDALSSFHKLFQKESKKEKQNQLIKISINPTIAKQNLKQCSLLDQESSRLIQSLNQFQFCSIDNKPPQRLIEYFPVDAADKLCFFYCTPDIMEGKMFIQKILIDSVQHNLYIGVCQKKQNKTLLKLNDLKQDHNGYYLIDKYGLYAFRNQRQQFNYDNQISLYSNSTIIEVQINRIENRVYFGIQEKKQNFFIEIPSDGIQKLCFGLQYGKIELIQS